MCSVWVGRKVKLNLSLCLIKYHFVKTPEGMEVQLHAFLTAALDGHEWSASRISCSSQVKKTGHVLGGRLVGPSGDV